MPTCRAALLSAVTLLAVPACSTTGAGPQKPVRWTVTAPSAAIAPNGTADIQLHTVIDGGWHIYAVNQGPGGPVPTRITLAPGQPFTLANSISATPPPRTQMDSSFNVNVLMHERAVTFVIPIRAGAAIRSGVDTLHINARYQACNATLCLPPQTARLSAPVRTTATG